jgi:hypothetical protein
MELKYVPNWNFDKKPSIWLKEENEADLKVPYKYFLELY